jgi:hypothetical protein
MLQLMLLRRKLQNLFEECSSETYELPALPHLEEADDDGEGHEEVDDGVGDIDDEDSDEVEVLLVDQGKVEDESDRQGHQGKQPCKNTMNTNLQKNLSEKPRAVWKQGVLYRF